MTAKIAGMKSDLEKCFRTQKEIIDEIPGFLGRGGADNAPLSTYETEAISAALKNSGVESAASRFKAEHANWLYEFLNVMVYSHSYPEGDEPDDLRFVPPTQVKYITWNEHDGDYVLQHRKTDGWRDFESGEELDIPPDAVTFDYNWLPPGCYRLREE